ncbi:MAG: hypothetical protein H7210_08555 [Pyrinomonadaceae bacterium]|nr:hypothetical protein [Phycisphaerales bacterium]
MPKAFVFQYVFVSMLLSSTVSANIDWDKLKLPAAVKLEVLGYNDDKPDEPFDKIIAEIGPDWVRSEQHLWEGEFKFRLFDVTYDTMDESILCNLNTKRGRRTTRMSVSASSRCEFFITPIVYVRMAKLIERRSGKIETSEKDGLITYSFSLPEGGVRLAEMVVDASSFEIREVRQPGTIKAGVEKYSDWKTLPDGSRHPLKIVSSFEMNGKFEGSRESRIASIELLKPDYVPARFKLPKDVEITDEIQGIVTNGEGTKIGTLEQTPKTQGAPTKSDWNWDRFFVPGGVGLIAASGLVWYIKRRRAGN